MSLTLIIIIITGLISYQAFNNPGLMYKLQHSPYQEAHNKEWYRFISSGFVHVDWTHLLINMFVFYSFGQDVEYEFVDRMGEVKGRVGFLAMYLLTIIFGDIPTFVKHKDNQGFASVGASGAVSGILFAFVIFQPWAMLLLFFVIPCPAIVAAVLYLVYSSWASRNQSSRIDHDAHFYGAVFGFIFTIVLQPSLFSLFWENLINGFPF